MIHIHRCTFLAQGNSAWENGTTISVNRVKKIIAKQLKGLEHLPGSVHLKKLTLDLGDFESLEFNREFIERLEHSCRDLEGKLRELQRSQVEEISPENKAHLDDLIAFLYSLEYTQSVQNTIYLLESTGVAPKLEAWNEFQLRYEKLFGSPMEDRLKKPLKMMLIPSKSTKGKNAVNGHSSNTDKKSKSGFKQEHIDFLIESLDRVPMNTNWFRTLEDWFMKEFGSKMSMELHYRIRKVYDTFEFGLAEKIKNNSASRQLDSRFDERLTQFFRELDDSKENQEMLGCLEEINVSNLDAILSRLIAHYKRAYEKPLPIHLERQLLRFGQMEKPLSWREVDRAKRQRITNKLGLLKELKSNPKSSREERIQNGFSQEEYDFLCNQLSQLPIDVAWFSKLLANYRKEFRKEMPDKLREIFLRFSQDIFLPELSIGNEETSDGFEDVLRAVGIIDQRSSLFTFLQATRKNPPRNHEDFTRFYKEYFGHDVSTEHSDLLVRANHFLREQFIKQAFSQRREQFLELFKRVGKSEKKGKGTLSGSQQDKFLLNPDMLKDLSFDFAWISRLDQCFQEVHQRGIPRKMMTEVLRFLNQTQSNVRSINSPMHAAANSGEVRISSIRSFLMESTEMADSEKLLEILPEQNDVQEWLNIEELISGFRTYYGRSLSEKLKGAIWSYYQESTPERSRLITKEVSEKAKISIENRVLRSDSSKLSELKVTESLKDFFAEQSELFTSSQDILPKFQSYLKEEKDVVLSRYEKSFLLDLWKEIERQMSFQKTTSSDFDALVPELNRLLKKTRKSATKSADLKLKKTNPKKQYSGVLHPDFIKEAIDFILTFLKQSSLPKNWKKLLNDSYRMEFKSEIPEEWQQILERYDLHERLVSSVDVTSGSVKSELIVYLAQNAEIPGSKKLLRFLSEMEVVNSLDELFEQYESKYDEALPLALKMTLNRWYGNLELEKAALEKNVRRETDLASLQQFIDGYIEKSEEEEQQLMQFLHLMLETVPMDACWLATVTEKYKTCFERNIPTQLFQQLLAFTSEFSPELGSIGESANLVETTYRNLMDLYDEVTSGMDASPVLERLQEVFTEMSLSKRQFTIVELMERFEHKFREDIPNELLDRVIHIYGKTLGYSWSLLPSKYRKGLVDEIRSALIDEAKSVQTNKEESSDFNTKLTFLIRALELTPIDVGWFAKLERSYSEEFGAKMTNKLKECLLNFAEKITVKPDIKAVGNSESQGLSFTRNKENTALLEKIKETLIGNSNSFQSEKLEGVGLDDRLTFFTHWLGQTTFDFSWFSKLDKAYRNEFKEEIPNELKKRILSFVEEVIADPNLAVGVNQSSPDQEVIDYFISLHLSEDVANAFHQFRMEIGDAQNELSLDEVISKYESDIGSFTEDQWIVLEELKKVFFERKMSANEDSKTSNFHSEIRRLYDDENVSLDDQFGTNSKQVDFVINFFEKKKINWNNLRLFEKEFFDEFKVKMNAKLTSAILKYLEQNTQSENQMIAPSHSQNLSKEETKSIKKTKTFERVEFQIESKAFLSSKLEQLMAGLTDLNQIKEEYFDMFGVEIPSKIDDFWKLKLSTALGRKTDLFNELNQFLRKKASSEQMTVLSELLESADEISEKNWFETILKGHKERFNTSLPLNLQQLLLQFASHRSTSKNSESQREYAQSERLKNTLFEFWEKFANDIRSERENDSNLKNLERLEFVSSWLRKNVLTLKELFLLEMKFHEKFQVPFPKVWRSNLRRFMDQNGIENLLQFSIKSVEDEEGIQSATEDMKSPELIPRSTTKIVRQKFQTELLEYVQKIPESNEKNILLKLVNSSTELLEYSWFQQLLEMYKLETKVSMPLIIQSPLLKFMQEQSRSTSLEQPEIDKQEYDQADRSVLLNELITQLDDVYLDYSAQHQYYFDVEGFISSLFDTNTASVSKWRKTYRQWFGGNLPDFVVKTLKGTSERKEVLKERLVDYLRKERAEELLHLIEKIDILTEGDWVEAIDAQSQLEFGRHISADETNLLIAFAANYEFISSESERQSLKKVDMVSIVDGLVGHIESNRRLFIRLTESYQLVKQALEASKGKSLLSSNEKRMLQRKFRLYLHENSSLKDLQKMIQAVHQFSKRSGHQQVSRSKLRPLKPAKRKMVSNKIKLIRLREELKAIKEGKKVEDSPIVTNAGLVFGWVFWKSTFEGFSWLEEGRFINIDGINSAVFAANWLHYSVGEVDTVNPLILFICGLEEHEFVRLAETKLEEEMNGESLSASIEGYYQLILSMWPIFDLEHLSDYIDLFVDREAIMQDTPVGTKLKLVKEPIDALTNDKPLPWPISIINFSWISQIIEVEW